MAKESPNVTSADVARAAQVSVGTVIRVLNNKPSVDEALRDKVLRVVKELGYVYVPKKRAWSTGSENGESGELLRTGPTLKSVLAYFPRRPASPLAEGYYYRVLRGMESECSDNDMHLVYNLLENQDDAIAVIRASLERSKADGVVLVNCGTPQLLQELAQARISVVAVEPNSLSNRSVDIVMDDDYEGGLLATQHLIDLGHRDIAFLTPHPLYYIAERRRAGYRAALIDAGLPLGPELYINGVNFEGAQTSVLQAINNGLPFSALFCFHDDAALGAMRAFTSKGLQIPRDMSIVGFDDLDAAQFAVPALTTINAATENKGRIAIRRLLDRIQCPTAAVTWSVMPVSLVVRASTAPFHG